MNKREEKELKTEQAATFAAMRSNKKNGRMLTKHTARELLNEAIEHIDRANAYNQDGNKKAAVWELRMGEAKAVVAQSYAMFMDGD